MNRNTDKSRKPLQQRSIARVESILKSALECFGMKGINAVSMKEIASHADVTASSIYQYFPDKNAIILELALRLKDQINNSIKNYNQKIASNDDVQSYALTILRNNYTFLAENPGWIVVINELRASNSDIETSQKHPASLVAEKLSGIVPKAKHKQLEKLCYWWGHVAFATLTVALETKEEEDNFILASETFVAKIQKLSN